MKASEKEVASWEQLACALADTEAARSIVAVLNDRILAIKNAIESVSDGVSGENPEEEINALVDQTKSQMSDATLKTNLDMGKAIFRALKLNPRVRAKA